MMKITLIVLSGLKESYWIDAAREYEKRLSRYCKLETIELNPVRLPDNPSASIVAAALESEADMIEKKIPTGAEVFAMCIEGKQMSSPDFSICLTDIANIGSGNAVFIIGSSYGLSERIKARAKRRFSMSKMTFPHKLARVMLLEQIYRAFQIAAGGEYHK